MLHDFIFALAGGGSSTRYGAGNKLLADLHGMPVFLHSIKRLSGLFMPGSIIMAVQDAAKAEFEAAAALHLPEIPVHFISGGSTRTETVSRLTAAAHEIRPDAVYIAIHDAARPLIAPETVLACAEKCRGYSAAIVAHKIVDTLKLGADGFIADTVPRENTYGAETPQMFCLSQFRTALAACAAAQDSLTDDALIMEKYARKPVAISENTLPNPKVTMTADLALCKALLSAEG